MQSFQYFGLKRNQLKFWRQGLGKTAEFLPSSPLQTQDGSDSRETKPSPPKLLFTCRASHSQMCVYSFQLETALGCRIMVITGCRVPSLSRVGGLRTFISTLQWPLLYNSTHHSGFISKSRSGLRLIGILSVIIANETPPPPWFFFFFVLAPRFSNVHKSQEDKASLQT